MEKILVVMGNEYIKKLIEILYQIEIWRGVCDKYADYNKGIIDLMDIFIKHRDRKNQLFFIGNGGSSAIAIHMTADYMKNGGMNTHSLYDNAVITCLGNDYGYEYIFSRSIDVLAKEGDLLVAISSSGNSGNIINAVKAAQEKQVEVITFTGFKANNAVKQMGDMNIYVPCMEYGIVESIHNLVLQQVVDMIVENDKK